MADHGVKIGPDGSDVKTTADKDLIWTSKNNGLNVLKHGFQAAAGTLAHGAGYVPFTMTFCETGDRYSLNGKNDWLTLDWADTPRVDSTNIEFNSVNNYYFIFVDKLE
jgi:hypothetical protein